MAEVAHFPAASSWEKRGGKVSAYPDQDQYFRENGNNDFKVGSKMGASDAQKPKEQANSAIESVANGIEAPFVANSDYKSAVPEDAVDSAQNAGDAPSKLGSQADDDLKPSEVGQSDLQEVEPESIGEGAKQGEEELGGITSKAGSAVREGASKLGSAVGAVGDVAKQGEEKAEDAVKGGEERAKDTAKKGEEKFGETEAQAGETAEEGKDKLNGTTEESKDKLGEAAEDVEAKLDDTAEKAGETAEGAKGAAADAGEQAGEAAEDVADQIDFSILKGDKVNKGGNVVNGDGKVVGRIKEGVLAHLVGKRVDETGAIWNDSGAVIGRAEPIPENEFEFITKESGPFEAFPDAVVNSRGMVVFEGEEIGKVAEGDAKKLRGMKVDPDGDILDRSGNVVGKAERWEPEPEPEAEPEPEVDRSILAGKRVNKAGNVVDGSGTIFGKVVEGDAKRMVGRMCDKKGNILSESGDVLGRAEVVSEGEREGSKEGPFAELSGLTVMRNGKVVTPGGDVVGRLVRGDAKTLAGRAEEPEVEKRRNPLAGRRVNREGNVVDQDGNLVGKLTTGELSICSGKEIDNDGDVIDGKGNTIGHVSLLEDIPPKPVEEESADDKAERELDEMDKELAKRMSAALTHVLDKIKPICDMITRKIEKADRTPKEELDEEELVKEVRPLIEEGGKILQEANGVIRGLDPDGRIQANAKYKAATREATPEEYHLADVLKDLTGTVTKCIDDAKKRLEGMPHAKKELNPLWGLLSEPLFQILAGVGLLLNGVLGLVGRLLSGLGLGGLVDSLLGGLGVKQILQSLGIGFLTDALTGKNQKKKSGGLLGLGG
ncbi:hypothetical protein RB595_010707 [Gaeumannomyces hyphopodioides]